MGPCSFNWCSMEQCGVVKMSSWCHTVSRNTPQFSSSSSSKKNIASSSGFQEVELLRKRRATFFGVKEALNPLDLTISWFCLKVGYPKISGFSDYHHDHHVSKEGLKFGVHASLWTNPARVISIHLDPVRSSPFLGVANGTFFLRKFMDFGHNRHWSLLKEKRIQSAGMGQNTGTYWNYREYPKVPWKFHRVLNRFENYRTYETLFHEFWPRPACGSRSPMIYNRYQ